MPSSRPSRRTGPSSSGTACGPPAGGIPPAPALSTHMPVNKMGPQDDPEAFLDLFEKTAEACGWPQMNWPVRLIPLLSGEAQLVAQQLPVQNLLVYDDLKRAIFQRIGRNPEQHRQRFRSLELGENGRPFVMAQQLWDVCKFVLFLQIFAN